MDLTLFTRRQARQQLEARGLRKEATIHGLALYSARSSVMERVDPEIQAKLQATQDDADTPGEKRKKAQDASQAPKRHKLQASFHCTQPGVVAKKTEDVVPDNTQSIARSKADCQDAVQDAKDSAQTLVQAAEESISTAVACLKDVIQQMVDDAKTDVDSNVEDMRMEQRQIKHETNNELDQLSNSMVALINAVKA
ncbi:hypothetical protein FSPOR_10607 [Fusarium sporotrichioides]|uniref:Uncharacterized protein n=1 Tax=Fusarium sporotrichioides TaxID=5514 RepID=A0A395RK18_FUSSP|nr:hypothetical protein FSPOR_10607 [Fusarium sporotrichioides]